MALEVQISAQGFDLDNKLHDYVNKKAVKLDRFLNGIREAHVDLKYSESMRDANDRFSAQITIHGKGYSLRTEERTADARSAFDSALDKMARRITSYKGRRFSVRGDGTSLSDVAADLASPAAESMDDELPAIARRKKLALLPMDEAEAIEQMRLLDHEDFFLFFNMETSAVNLLYRRRDGSYGLIETELA
jgi:putative sigma-54 modulation protein